MDPPPPAKLKVASSSPPEASSSAQYPMTRSLTRAPTSSADHRNTGKRAHPTPAGPAPHRHAPHRSPTATGFGTVHRVRDHNSRSHKNEEDGVDALRQRQHEGDRGGGGGLSALLQG